MKTFITEMLKALEKHAAEMDGQGLANVFHALATMYVGAPRGLLHGCCSTRGIADLFYTDVRSILMVLLAFQRPLGLFGAMSPLYNTAGNGQCSALWGDALHAG